MVSHLPQTVDQTPQTVTRSVAPAQADGFATINVLSRPASGQLLPANAVNTVDLSCAVMLTDIERSLGIEPDQQKDLAERLRQISDATAKLQNQLGAVVMFKPTNQPLLLFIILHSPE